FTEASVELQGVEILTNNENFSIINIYRHPNRDTPAQFFEDLMRFNVTKGNCILMGDLNAHHNHWGCRLSDRAGKRILAACEDSSVCVLGDHISTLLKGLSLSLSKSSWMIFTTSKITPAPNCSLSINNHLVARVEKVKFLGIILDYKLKGTSHLEYLVKKRKALVNIISTLTVWWRSHPHCLLTIYRAVFRGAVEYACTIFTWKNNARIFRQLERLQYKAIRVSMGYRLSTPINVMLCEAKEYPLKLRFNLLSERFVVKCISKRNYPVIDSIKSLKSSLCTPSQKAQTLAKSPSLRCYIINKHDSSHLHSSYFIPAFKSSLHAFILRKHFEYFIYCTRESNNNEIIQSFNCRLQEVDPSDLTIYTDGSKLSEDGCAGAAFHSPELKHCFKYKLTYSASVFTAEAWAIYQALIFSTRRGLL
ncbi:hypothetical protein ALC62_00169, partial [Cyphomyrmex costatus]